MYKMNLFSNLFSNFIRYRQFNYTHNAQYTNIYLCIKKSEVIILFMLVYVNLDA